MLTIARHQWAGEQIAMTMEELAASAELHDRQIADLRASAADHDRQIRALADRTADIDRQLEALIQATMENTRFGKELDRRIEALARQWQAYLNTLPRQ